MQHDFFRRPDFGRKSKNSNEQSQVKVKKSIYRLLIVSKRSGWLGGIPLHNYENYHPFFIIGSGRSGNTLLRRILNNHSALFIPPETYELGRSIRQSLKYPIMSWMDLVSLIYSNFQFNAEFETFGLNNLTELYHRVAGVHKAQRSVAYIINAFYDYYREMHDIESNRWGDKTPLNTLSIPEIYSVFPNAKFVHIIRDPVDCVASFLKTGIFDDIPLATFRWKQSQEAAIQFGKTYPDQYIQLTYENLVRTPEFTVKRACGFLNVNYHHNLLSIIDTSQLGDVNLRYHHKNVNNPINTLSIGNGYRHLHPNDIKLIKDILIRTKNRRLLQILSQYWSNELQ